MLKQLLALLCLATIVVIVMVKEYYIWEPQRGPGSTGPSSSISGKTFNTVRLWKEAEMKNLTASLEAKLKAADKTPDRPISEKKCSDINITNYNDNCNPRDRKCPRNHLPVEARERVAQLVTPTYILGEHEEALAHMRSQIDGRYDIIVASAVSSNHFDESQAMLENYHKFLYPELKNFLLVIYDIGLKTSERHLMEKHCRCKVITFPFHLVPPHVSHLMCYAWKPFIVAAHYEQAEVIMWTDASIRFTNSGNISAIIERTKMCGVQQKTALRSHPITYYTIPMVFESFGDSPCIYRSFQMVEGNFMLFHREPLIRRAVIQPWLWCAGREDCMCPPQFRGRRFCWYITEPLNKVGMRNCFDQSVLTVILAKLFREKYDHFVVDTSYVQLTQRGNKGNYLNVMERESNKKKKSGGE